MQHVKRIFFIFLIFVSANIFAQIDFRNTRYGINAGATYSRVSNAHNPSGPRYSVYGGFLALIPVDNSDQFYIQPEVVYFGAGEGGDKKVESPYGVPHAVYGNNYISVPIYFKGFFSEAETEFFAIAGPRFNFLIGQTIKNPAKPIYTVDGVGDVNGKANFLNIGISLGVGFSYKRKLEITGRYDIGLSNTYKGLMKEYGTDPNIQRKKSEQVLSAGLSYIFD